MKEFTDTEQNIVCCAALVDSQAGVNETLSGPIDIPAEGRNN
jgi:hypothetical protein